MNNEVEQIKDRLDIAEIISSYLTLKRAGKNFKANCPFHNEKTPSLMISPERQTFKCFGCGEGGDVFTFIEKIEGIDFYNTLKLLADRAGVTLTKNSIKYGDKEHKSDKKTRIFEINNWAKKVYHKILTDHSKAEIARKYLKDRGISEKTILEFEIGYAPNSWDFLLRFLTAKKYSKDEMVQAGVLIRNEKGDYYDRFRGRIMFPINNIMGVTVAFTSRVLDSNDKDVAKYINSSESPIYTKGKTIYGLDKAKMVIKEKDLAVFVEGNMDVIACHQAGFKNVVATSGTAITEDQIKILRRYTEEIAFCFDSDVAGESAMKKAVQIALKNDINSKVVSLPVPFKDPDEAIKSNPKNWEKAVEKAKPSLEHWINLLIRKEPELEVSTKKKITKEILPIIKTIYSPIEKEYYIKYLSKKLFVSENSLLDALEKTKTEALDNKNQPLKEKIQNKLTVEEKIVGFLWGNHELIKKFKKEVSLVEFSDKKFSPFLEMVKKGEIVKEELPQSLIQDLNQLQLMVLEGEEFVNDETSENELRYLFARMSSQKKESLRSDFAQKIQEAETTGDREKVKELLVEFSNLIK